MPSSRKRTAVIAGGSVGGLFIGNMLLRRGWAVDISERATSGLESRGARIAGHAELTAIPKTIGASAIGMVISIETAIPHPKPGFIKLEDTMAETGICWPEPERQRPLSRGERVNRQQ